METRKRVQGGAGQDDETVMGRLSAFSSRLWPWRPLDYPPEAAGSCATVVASSSDPDTSLGNDLRMEPTPRRAARLLVIDSHSGAVLLFQYEDGDRSWWATPGGALECDETFEEAAIREAAEELAIASRSFVPLWHRTVEFSFRGITVRQEEQYFLLRILPGDVVLGQHVREAHRHEGIIATRWWSLEEIETTSEQVFPEDLPQRLRQLR